MELAGRGQVFHPQDFVARSLRQMAGHEGDDLASDHLLDDTVGICIRCFFRGNMAAVAQDGDGVAEPENLLHTVRYVDDRDASLTEMVQQAEQVLAFMDRKGTGRLVHDDDLGPRPDRGSDLNDLLLTGR